MTIASEVKQCAASLRGVKAGLSALILKTSEEEAKPILHQTMGTIQEISLDLQKRIKELEHEEPQYKGF